MSGSRRYAFITGINRYGKNIPPLGSAVRDAQAIARILADIHGYEVDLHIDEDATLEKLRALFNGLPGRVSEDDRVVIYFAGHGIAETGGDGDVEGPRGYFVPQDADRDNLQSFLPMAEVQQALDQLKCKHVLILLDCCFAGAFKWTKTRAIAGRPIKKKLTKERYERYLRDPARQVITSASSNETALDVVSGKVLGTRDVGEGHSPFALALISALRESAADVGFDGRKGDGVTTAAELHLYIESVMAQAESGLGRAMQRPMLWQIDNRGQGEFIFEMPGRQTDLPSALSLSDENNPYRGLQSYDEKHSAMFFGREKLTEQLAAVVAAQSMTLVVGASGSGKSSLVKAGLVHHLKQKVTRWAIMPPVRPGTSPAHALEVAAHAIEAWSADGSGAGSPPHADAKPPTLAEATRQLRAREPALEVLLIVDQLEELVTMASHGDERASFFAALEEARAAGLRVIGTLRADFEPHFLEISRDNPGARFPVRSMSREELREVIEGPAREHVLDFDPPALVDELIDEVHDSPGALPLLSFTLSELYRERIKRDATDRALTKTDYDKLGGVTGALGTRADKIYDGQPDETAKKTMARVLLRLVSLKGGEAAKRRLLKRELDSTDADETARAARIVKELSEARLVVEGREDDVAKPGSAPAGEKDANVYVEAAHDKLVTGWKTLWEILAEYREELPLLRSCTVAAEEWRVNGHDAARLWNADPRLPQLQALRKKDALQFNALETRFLVRSGERRRNRYLALGVAVVLVIAGLSMTSLLTLISRGKAVAAQEKAKDSAELAEKEKIRAQTSEKSAKQSNLRALHSRLVAEAGRDDMGVTQEQALLLSVEASRRGETLDTDSGLRAVQDRTAATARILRFGQDIRVSGLAWAPASLGRRLIAGSGGDHSVVLWSPATGAELSRIKLDNDVDQVRWNPLAERLLVHTGWWHQWAVVSTAKDALKVQTSAELRGTKTQQVAWSPDGKLALLVGIDEVEVWSADKAAVIGWIQMNDLEIAEGSLLPGGKEVLLCGRSKEDKLGYAAIYRVQSSPRAAGKPVRVLEDNTERVDHCTVSADGRWYATTTDDGVDLHSSGAAPPRHLHVGAVGALAFDHRSLYLAAGTTTGMVGLWHVKVLTDSSQLQGHAAGLVSVQWGFDNIELLTSSADGTAIIWNTFLSTKVVVLSGHDGPLTGAAWDPTDPMRVATSSEDGTVRIFQRGLTPPLSFGQDAQDVLDATYDPSGKVVAIADKQGVVTLRAADTTAEVRHFGGGSDRILTVRYCPDGATLVTRDARRCVKLWAADTGALKQVLSGTADPESTPTCSRDGRFIAAFDRDSSILWEAASGERTETRYPGQRIVDPIWHPQRNVVAQRVWASTEQVQLLGPDLGAPRSLEGNVDGVNDVAWSHEGARLVSGDNGTPGGKNGRIHLYDKVLERAGDQDNKPTRDVPQGGNEKTFSISWSPDDAFLVTGGSDAGRVWDTKDWTLKSRLAAHELSQVVWTPGPRSDRVAAVDKHGLLRLFDPSTGALLGAPIFQGRTVKNAAFNPDGTRLLVLLSDDTARIIAVYQSELESQLCNRAIRNFTREEWKYYLGDEVYSATCKQLPIEPEPASEAPAPPALPSP